MCTIMRHVLICLLFINKLVRYMRKAELIVYLTILKKFENSLCSVIFKRSIGHQD